MKRNIFIKAFTSFGVFASASINSFAKSVNILREKRGFMVNSGKDRFDHEISLFEGDIFDCKVSSKDTDGDIYVFESNRTKEGGPSHHYHFEQDEWWYVLEGKFIFKIGEIFYQANAGDSIFGPRMVPHSFAKVGDGAGKLLMFFQPAGKMEEFFNKISSGVAKNMTEFEQDKLREEHGFKRIGPPIKDFKKW